jgi:ethanolamine ammonia-lyase small subunit
MARDRHDALVARDWSALMEKIRAQTPARLLSGRVGAAYRTATQLELRDAHASARDAVRCELNLERDLGTVFLKEWDLFEVSTQAANKDEYLLRPDRGRHFTTESRATILKRCPSGKDVQVVIGDGLSIAAISAQVPGLVPLLCEGIRERGWTFGQVFAIHYCRVGILNEIGELLRPKVVILLIGERPGLATAESLSAYLAHEPRESHTDANRNLISNIHARGVPVPQASARILHLVEQMMNRQTSGYHLREELPSGTDALLHDNPSGADASS